MVVSYCGMPTLPSPDSVKKFIIFNGLRERCGAKILLALDLAAEYSQHWSYGWLCGDFGVFVSHCGVRALARTGSSVRNFNIYCAMSGGNSLHGGLGVRVYMVKCRGCCMSGAQPNAGPSTPSTSLRSLGMTAGFWGGICRAPRLRGGRLAALRMTNHSGSWFPTHAR
jgi:hypothetical protein